MLNRVSRLSAVNAPTQALARKHAGRACASHKLPFGNAGAGLARTALRAKARLGAKGWARRAVSTAEAFTRRTVAAAKTAGAARTTRCLAAAVVAEATFTEPPLRCGVARCVAEPALRPAGVTKAPLRVALVTVTTTLRA